MERRHRPSAARGFTVVAPPNPLRGPTDAPYLAAFLETVTGPIVLVAHSYGGFVITNVATGNPNVKALVYIDAFIPDEGEAPVDLNSGSCLDAATAFNVVPVPGDVDLYLQAAPNRPYRASRSASPTASTAAMPPFSSPPNARPPSPRSPSFPARQHGR